MNYELLILSDLQYSLYKGEILLTVCVRTLTIYIIHL